MTQQAADELVMAGIALCAGGLLVFAGWGWWALFEGAVAAFALAWAGRRWFPK